MSKPTREKVLEALHYKGGWQDLENANRIMGLLDAWETEDAEERERLTQAAQAVYVARDYGRHHSWCEAVCNPVGTCNCGFADAIDALRESGPPSGVFFTAAREDEGDTDSVERFNELQRVRREAYAAVLENQGYADPRERAQAAASHYPLKKRVPKVIPDPDSPYRFSWRFIAAGNRFEWLDEGGVWRGSFMSTTPGITPNRIRALAALLSDPWEIIEDTEVEDVTP